MSTTPKIVPRLIVAGAARAIDWYAEALGATVSDRYAMPDGLVVHAELRVGDAVFTLADEHREWGNDAPTSLGGSPVVLTLHVDDADAFGARMQRAGATVAIPIEDRFYGAREGRLIDPFGHIWILSQHLETLSGEEIARRVAAFGAGD